MKPNILILLLLGFTFLGFTFLGAQEAAQEDLLTLSVSNLPELIQQNSPSWKAMETRTSLALGEVNKSRWIFRPDLSLTPTYTWQDTEILEIETRAHTAGLSLGSSWLLPSDGIFALSADNTSTFAETDLGSWISQSPGLTLSYTQPVWVNGKLIAPELYKAYKAQALEIPATRALLSNEMERNSLIQTAVSFFSNADIARGQAGLKAREWDLRRRELDFMAQRRNQGLLSGNDYWSNQMETSLSEDELVELMFQAEEAEATLAAALGLPRLPLLDSKLPVLSEPPQFDKIISQLEELNPSLLNTRLTMEETAFTKALLQKANGGSLTAALTINPSHGGDNTEDFLTSVTDHFAEDPRLNPVISLSYSTSVASQAKSAIQGRMNTLESERSLEDYMVSVEEAKRTLSSLYNRAEMLEIKSAQILESIAYMEKLVEKEEELLNIASSTTLQVDWARWNRDSRKESLRSVHWEILKNRLEISNFIGEDLEALMGSGE